MEVPLVVGPLVSFPSLGFLQFKYVALVAACRFPSHSSAFRNVSKEGEPETGWRARGLSFGHSATSLRLAGLFWARETEACGSCLAVIQR